MSDRTFSFTIPEGDDEATAIMPISMTMDELALDHDQRRRIAEYFYDRYPHNSGSPLPKEENNEQHF